LHLVADYIKVGCATMKMHNFDPPPKAKCVLESPLNGIEMNCDLLPISTSSNQ